MSLLEDDKSLCNHYDWNEIKSTLEGKQGIVRQMDLWVVSMSEIKMIVDDGIGTYLDCDDLYWLLYD